MKKNYNFINNYKIELIVILILLLISIGIYYFYKKYNSYENFTTSTIDDWRQLGIDIDGKAAGDYSGHSVALSGDGTVVAIGSPFNSGKVRVLEWINNSWEQRGLDFNGDYTNMLGYSVALSKNGTIVAIGAPYGGHDNNGHVKMYQWLNGKWENLGDTIIGKRPEYCSGTSIALSDNGNIIAITAGVLSSYTIINSGYVNIYKLGNDNKWYPLGNEIMGKYARGKTGASIALSSDGMTIAISTPENNSAGASVYRLYNNIEWKQLGNNIYNESSVWYVSLSSNGNIVALGKNGGDNSNIVKIYHYINVGWEPLGGDIIDNYSYVNNSSRIVSLNSNGTIIAIGARFNDNSGLSPGHVRIYHLINNLWKKYGNDINGEAVDNRFGHSVALSSDGKIVAIGAWANGANGSNSGHVRIYTAPAPINCIGEFVNTGDCSKTCGGGIQTKTYTITTPAQYGGTSCPNLNGDTQTQPCNTQPCPINCSGEFGPFSQCSKTCGGGTQTKTYAITTPAQYGGAPCPNLNGDIQTQSCNTQPCPIDCEGSYGEFSQCSKTCGGGTKTKPYEITTPAQHGGTPCPISPPINETCNTQPCPIDCEGYFITTEKCSKECDGGKETIKYVISQEGKNGGKECEYTDGYTDRVDCNIFECANTLDTPYYKRFKPLEYNKDRSYYWRSDKLVEEGIRRNQDDLKQIQNLQTSFESETDEKKKKELQDELDLYKWRDNILETKDNNTGLSRDKRDIITDYYPEEIGQPRVWMERHSHIPDYSY